MGGREGREGGMEGGREGRGRGGVGGEGKGGEGRRGGEGGRLGGMEGGVVGKCRFWRIHAHAHDNAPEIQPHTWLISGALSFPNHARG